jgi:hypothetical protein
MKWMQCTVRCSNAMYILNFSQIIALVDATTHSEQLRIQMRY